jgi:DNA-binding NarL/FixJ family response regulator
VACLAEGLFYKEIEDRLSFSAAVVRKLAHCAFVKLKAGNRTEAVLKWQSRTDSSFRVPTSPTVRP